MRRHLTLAFLACIVVTAARAQQYTIKFATLAPDGSTWMNVMHEYDAAVRKESGGRVGFKLYPGGVQGGDEKAMLRKIRVGQIHSGGFTGVGLGEIAPKVRILDAPFLFRTYDEVDHIYKTFDKELTQALEDGGFVLLGWAELGFVNVFTNSPVNKPEDLKGLRMWTWEGDVMAQTALQTLGLSPIPLSIDNVLTSLQTGLINAFYTTPYAAIALQWYTRSKYVIDVPLADASGAVLLSKKYFDTLPADLQEVVVRNGRTAMVKLVQLNREDNKNAFVEFRKRGIVIQQVAEKDLGYYIDVGVRSRRAVVGRTYSQEFLNQVERAVDEYRAGRKGVR
ncbi:MAG: TRAP transporter substrate-binding protein DctP [Bacteroidota bacterium]